MMENLDVSVIRHLLQWRQNGQNALLATVIRTWGSSPRPVGSIMALCESGSVVGSVSGGCIEDDLIHRYRSYTGQGHTIPCGPPERVRYGVSADEAHRFGLPCGGTLELLLEFNPEAASLAELLRGLEGGQLMQRDTEIATGQVRLAPLDNPQPLQDDGKWLRNSFGPEYRMLLIGSGQLSEFLATMARYCGFAVSVCDPREEYRASWSVPEVQLLTGMPDDVLRDFGVDRRTAVIALTHDPKLDDLALLDALESEAFYIGAIGSRRNNRSRRQRMIEHFEQTEESLSRLRGPIGLYIGSKMPSEIAVSIMAEVLAVKNGVALPASMQVEHAKVGLAVPASDPGAMVCGVT
jgi:xanthine dehydrogenase accessory factor